MSRVQAVNRDLEAAVSLLDARTRWLWLLAIAGYAVGDVVTTLVGLSVLHPVVLEVGPVAGPAIRTFGTAAMVPLKALVFLLAAVLWWLAPRPQAVGVPLGLAVTGVLVTVWNAVVLLGAVLL